jgi:hypothetical protein
LSVRTLLTANSAGALADEFETYRLAINVLKHGTGQSHKKLRQQISTLPFKLESFLGELCEEGDVCPSPDLISVTPEFLEQCCDVVERTWNFICELDGARRVLA